MIEGSYDDLTSNILVNLFTSKSFYILHEINIVFHRRWGGGGSEGSGRPWAAETGRFLGARNPRISLVTWGPSNKCIFRSASCFTRSGPKFLFGSSGPPGPVFAQIRGISGISGNSGPVELPHQTSEYIFYL